MMAEETRVIFVKLDHHDERIRELESDRKMVMHRLGEAEANYQNMCRQLVTTETKLMTSIVAISEKQDQLIADQNKREGASGAVKWFWALLGITLTCLQIYQVIKS